MGNMRSILLGGVVVATLMLGACSRSYLDELSMNEETVLRRGWIPARHLNAPSVYCYRTMASPECYDEPEEGAETRLISHFGNPPEFR